MGCQNKNYELEHDLVIYFLVLGMPLLNKKMAK